MVRFKLVGLNSPPHEVHLGEIKKKKKPCLGPTVEILVQIVLGEAHIHKFLRDSGVSPALHTADVNPQNQMFIGFSGKIDSQHFNSNVL